MTRTKSTIGVSAVVCLGCALVVAACDSGSESIEIAAAGSSGVGGHNGTAGHATTGGSTNTAGNPGTGGSAGTVSGGAGGAAGAGGAVNNCTKLPMSLLLTDFSPATFKAADNTSWKTSKADLWGSSMSLTGGDVFYQGKAESAPTVTVHGQTLTISASVAAGDYAGYMFNFKPACTNASMTTGLKFDVLSDSTVGNATLKVQMQQKSDYPSTANPGSRPGDCVPTSASTQYQECLSPATTVVSSGSTITPGTVELPWTNFGGGAPVPTVDNGQLMAIQWQFECPPGGGTVLASGGSGGTGAGGSASVAGAGGSSAGSAAGGSDTGGVSSGGASAGTSGDPGIGGSGGSSGSVGSNAGGSSGSAGSSAGAGDAGSGGTSGASTGGSSSGGSATGGSATGGSSSGGSTGATPPCVVSITIDNVTFY